MEVNGKDCEAPGSRWGCVQLLGSEERGRAADILTVSGERGHRQASSRRAVAPTFAVRGVPLPGMHCFIVSASYFHLWYSVAVEGTGGGQAEGGPPSTPESPRRASVWEKQPCTQPGARFSRPILFLETVMNLTHLRDAAVGKSTESGAGVFGNTSRSFW